MWCGVDCCWIRGEQWEGYGFDREHRVFPVPPLTALMAGAFLLPALSPEDGIPVEQTGSCSAALHCDELSSDVFLLSLLSTMPILLFSVACLQPWYSFSVCLVFLCFFKKKNPFVLFVFILFALFHCQNRYIHNCEL